MATRDQIKTRVRFINDSYEVQAFVEVGGGNAIAHIMNGYKLRQQALAVVDQCIDNLIAFLEHIDG